MKFQIELKGDILIVVHDFPHRLILYGSPEPVRSQDSLLVCDNRVT